MNPYNNRASIQIPEKTSKITYDDCVLDENTRGILIKSRALIQNRKKTVVAFSGNDVVVWYDQKTKPHSQPAHRFAFLHFGVNVTVALSV